MDTFIGVLICFATSTIDLNFMKVFQLLYPLLMLLGALHEIRMSVLLGRMNILRMATEEARMKKQALDDEEEEEKEGDLKLDDSKKERSPATTKPKPSSPVV